MIELIRNYLIGRLNSLTKQINTSATVGPEVDDEYQTVTDLLHKLVPKKLGINITINGVWTGTVAQWWHVGPLLVQLCEVQEVRLTGKMPDFDSQSGSSWGWYIARPFKDMAWLDDAEFLPSEFWDELDEEERCYQWYPNEKAALADASRRAIAWARKEAGLS